MAKIVKKDTSKKRINPPHRVTSIGRSVNTKPTHKDAKRGFKSYRGQGK